MLDMEQAWAWAHRLRLNFRFIVNAALNLEQSKDRAKAWREKPGSLLQARTTAKLIYLESPSSSRLACKSSDSFRAKII